MKTKYSIEGYRPKTSLEDENTLKLDDKNYETIEEATLRAKALFDSEPDLGLAVIYRESPDGTREGLKFIFKAEDGTFEDFPLYWGTGDSCSEG